jgi:hypothetical protein
MAKIKLMAGILVLFQVALAAFGIYDLVVGIQTGDAVTIAFGVVIVGCNVIFGAMNAKIVLS